MPETEVAADVAVIGAGVIGLSVAHRFSKMGKKVVVVEKELDAGMGVTAGQANVVHVVQLPFGSFKSRLARKGNRMYDELCSSLGVKLDRMQALLVVRGWLRIPAMLVAYVYLRFGLRGEFRVRLMRGSSLRKLEPLLADGVTGGAVVDGYGTVDAHELVSALRAASERLGARFVFGCEVTSAERSGGVTTLKTTKWDVKAKLVVNAAGLYSDEVALMFGKDPGRLEPGLGVMAVYSGLGLRSIVAPLPLSIGSRTKGGAIIPATDGTTIIGPTLRVASSKDDTKPTDDDLALLSAKFRPLLKTEGKQLRVYTGMRPLSPTKDFIIDFDRERMVVHLVGIESPGLTAAPAIAEAVEHLVSGAAP